MHLWIPTRVFYLQTESWFLIRLRLKHLRLFSTQFSLSFCGSGHKLILWFERRSIYFMKWLRFFFLEDFFFSESSAWEVIMCVLALIFCYILQCQELKVMRSLLGCVWFQWFAGCDEWTQSACVLLSSIILITQTHSYPGVGMTQCRWRSNPIILTPLWNGHCWI